MREALPIIGIVAFCLALVFEAHNLRKSRDAWKQLAHKSVESTERAVHVAKTAADKLEHWVTNGLMVIQFETENGPIFMQPDGTLTKHAIREVVEEGR